MLLLKDKKMVKVSFNGMVNDNMVTLLIMQEMRAYLLPLWQLMMLVVNMLRQMVYLFLIHYHHNYIDIFDCQKPFRHLTEWAC